jgi:glyoxylase-like metal-dependent hydrolase (beta-lactamase superfamily II)/rhodanese-related sulfurtransferase
MSAPPLPELSPDDLARRLDAGERVQLLDVRAPTRLAEGRIAFGAALEFTNLAASQLYALPTLDPLGLDPGAPVAVVCGHGNSSRQATAYLRQKGFEAYSVTGGMAGWDTVFVERRLAATASVEHVVQLDRLAKGALSYVLASDGEAVVIDPARHLARYESVLRSIGAKPRAVIDTHMHADYLSGARAAAARWQVPYFLHPADAVSPYDGTPAKIASQPVDEGDVIAFGRATLRVEHTPGHTLGSLTLIADETYALTGDFLFVQSIGRPDLGGRGPEWAKLLWASLERARRTWPGDRMIVPAHYAHERERRADRAVAARFDLLAAANVAARMQDERAFTGWIAEQTKPAPESYRTIKLANLGLRVVSDADAEMIEAGPNQCAIA